MFVQERQSNPRVDATSKIKRLRKLAGGNRSLLDTSMPARWGLLQLVAQRLHGHATADLPGASADARLAGFIVSSFRVGPGVPLGFQNHVLSSYPAHVAAHSMDAGMCTA